MLKFDLYWLVSKTWHGQEIQEQPAPDISHGLAVQVVVDASKYEVPHRGWIVFFFGFSQGGASREFTNKNGINISG
jgi:hypothetical protein